MSAFDSIAMSSGTVSNMMASASKPKFRARKLDPSRSLKIYRYDEIEGEDVEDLLTPGGSMRAAVSIISTGVDKEEEEEEHLQAALTTAMVAPKDQQYFIPTPDAQPLVGDYELLYPSTFRLSKATYLKAINRLNGDLLDNQLPSYRERPSRYNCDHSDFAFCNSIAMSVDVFEVVMEWCEMMSRKYSQNVISLEKLTESLPWLSSDNNCNSNGLHMVLEYWKGKQQSPLAILKHEDIGKIGADPYVCFRRRELRQPRKTRRSDSQCIDRIRKLKWELDTIASTIGVAIKRDKWRLESILLEREIFNKYSLIDGMQESLSKFPPFKEAISLSVPQVAAVNTSKRSRRRRSGTSSDKLAITASKPPKPQTISFSEFKASEYFRPYYPMELLKQIKKDILYTSKQYCDDCYTDLLSELWEQDFDDFIDTQYYRRAPTDLPQAPPNRMGRDIVRARRGRGGRLLIDYEGDFKRVLCGRQNTHDSDCDNSGNDILRNRPDLYTRLSLLTLKECAQLNHQSIGNYNHHYIQATSQLTRPYTFFGWLTATTSLQSSTGNNTNPNNTSATTSKRNSRVQSPSKKPRMDAPIDNSKQSPALGNIIVKVKKSTNGGSTKSNLQASSSEGGASSSNNTTPHTPPPSQLLSAAKRFTPNGLSPD